MDFDTFRIIKFAYDMADTNPANVADIQRAVAAHNIINGRIQKMLATEGFGSDINNFLPQVAAAATKHFQECLQPGQTVQPILPILSEPIAQEYVNRINSLIEGTEYDRRELAAQLVAAYLYEFKNVWLTQPSLNMPPLPPIIMAEFNDYSTWRIGEKSQKSEADIFGIRYLDETRTKHFNEEVDRLISEQTSRIGTLSTIANEGVRKFDDTIQRLEVQGDAAQKQIDNITSTLEVAENSLQQIMNEVDTREASITAFKTAVRVDIGTNATRELWWWRGLWSATAFWISALVIAAAIAVPPIYAIMNIESVLSLLRRIGDAAAQGLPDGATAAQITATTISRLVVISTPLALYFWAIKLLVRFNTRSMILMDDARQRYTTMMTYSYLVEEKTASLEERGLMLTALFRPLPGQGPENVEPPNFVDLIGKKGE